MSDEIREWVVYRDRTQRDVYTGIKATSAEEAIDKWRNGAGELQQDLSGYVGTTFDAVDVR